MSSRHPPGLPFACLLTHLLEYVERFVSFWQLSKNDPDMAAVHRVYVVPFEGDHELSAMPFNCGLHTGLCTDSMPSARA